MQFVFAYKIWSSREKWYNSYKKAHAWPANSFVLYFDLSGSQDVSCFQDKESEFLVITIPDMTSEAPFSKKFRVTDQVRRSFDKEGFFILRSLFSKEEVNLFRFFLSELMWCDCVRIQNFILVIYFVLFAHTSIRWQNSSHSSAQVRKKREICLWRGRVWNFPFQSIFKEICLWQSRVYRLRFFPYFHCHHCHQARRLKDMLMAKKTEQRRKQRFLFSSSYSSQMEVFGRL